jgi:hypothetical protein
MSNTFDPSGTTPSGFVQSQHQAVSELRPRINEAVLALKRARELCASKNPKIAELADVLLSALGLIDRELDKWPAEEAQPSVAWVVAEPNPEAGMVFPEAVTVYREAGMVFPDDCRCFPIDRDGQRVLPPRNRATVS